MDQIIKNDNSVMFQEECFLMPNLESDY